MKNNSKRAPSVCIVRRDYYPDGGHVRRDAVALIEAGYQVDIISLRRDGQPRYEEIDGVKVHRLPVQHRRGGIIRYLGEYLTFFLTALMVLSYLAFKRRYKVVEIDTMPDFLVFAAIVPKLMGAKVVLYLFECMPELFEWVYGMDSDHVVISTLKRTEVLATKFADHCITYSDVCRGLFVGRGADDAKFSGIPNVPDVSHFLQGISLNGAKESGKDFTIITHGTILERYGIQTLFAAIPLVRDRIPNLRIEILGKGEYREDLELLAAELDIEEMVNFRGFVSDEEMVRALSAADLGFVGVTFPYMSPNKMFEYVCVKTPLVASAIPGMTDWFSSSEMSFFKPSDEKDLADKIIELYESPEMRRDLAAQAERKFSDYRWESSKKTYLGIYSQLISKKEVNQEAKTRPEG